MKQKQNIDQAIARQRQQSIKTYTSIAKRRIEKPGYTFHDPAVVKALLMFYIDGGMPPIKSSTESSNVRAFVRRIYTKARNRRIRRTFYKKPQYFFSVENLAKEFGIPNGYAYVVTLSLGFHVNKETLQVKMPDTTSLSFYENVYYDAAISYRLVLADMNSKLDPSVSSIYNSAMEQVERTNVQYALAIATASAYDPVAMDPKQFQTGFFQEAPQWFLVFAKGFRYSFPTTVSTEAPPLPPRESIDDAVDTSIAICEAEMETVKKEYEKQLQVVRNELSNLHSIHNKILHDNKQSMIELDDVRSKLTECTSKLARAGIPETQSQFVSTTKELYDVTRKLSDVNEDARVANKVVGDITNNTYAIPETVNKSQGEARQNLLDSIRRGKHLKPVVLKTKPKESQGGSYQDLSNSIKLAMQKRRPFIDVENDEEGEEPEPFEAKIERRFGRQKIREPRRYNREKRVISPTSRAFGDVHGLL